MERNINDKQTQYLINADILAIMKYTSEINWDSVRQNSIFRILYLSSVLYSFIHLESNNPFKIYRFSIDKTGPYDSRISDSIDFLIKDDYICRASGDDIFRLGENQIEGLFSEEVFVERVQWIKSIIYILGIYGENKIYDFIFRDPEYQTSIKSNTLQGLNTEPDNQTIKTLNLFRSAFEESISSTKTKIAPQTYLELYFDYVFSKILKREE